MTAHPRTLTADRFEADRPLLRAVAHRLLGSLGEADDAVQETWLRASRADIGEVENLTAWLTTVVGRVSLNMLRSRRTRREEPLELQPGEEVAAGGGGDPAEEALLADEVGVALLVVLDTLGPDERLAFVLHDLFAVPFDAIAPLIERTPATTRQLASRARRRVRGGTPPVADAARQRQVVEAFLAATRGGDFDALLALLHPDVVLTADRFVVPTPGPVSLSGGRSVAESAMTAAGRARYTGPALLDGRVGLVMAPLGRLRLALLFTVADERITGIEIVADRERLAALEVAVPGA
ncbi:sigma-70 family RNA polymerase sigma factor [Streptomyces phaeoluteigriseus]|uniref:Sigma-70 family RNA polymerase sigma factor n=1 Tax=Streptomyces phaeoluteigriseus TaxID=114686 RepID=A0ABY4Z5P2_9ACTN|nr:sigma-70 family RNA polymerase sigma factor [Streptomyces phaeoluteigriseus]USQ84301.1 sigma-70 family RNA polymerase sigma factor [Streptomyces phaeoluteigriseus]